MWAVCFSETNKLKHPQTRSAKGETQGRVTRTLRCFCTLFSRSIWISFLHSLTQVTMHTYLLWCREVDMIDENGVISSTCKHDRTIIIILSSLLHCIHDDYIRCMYIWAYVFIHFIVNTHIYICIYIFIASLRPDQLVTPTTNWTPESCEWRYTYCQRWPVRKPPTEQSRATPFKIRVWFRTVVVESIWNRPRSPSSLHFPDYSLSDTAHSPTLEMSKESGYMISMSCALISRELQVHKTRLCP